jgi:LAS superfamily LD-carboxypeptidase LdcB
LTVASSWRRTVTGLLLGTALAAAGVAALPPAAARADTVASAQARVDALKALARTTTAQLTAGTARWEADQKRLRQLQLDLAGSTQRLAGQQVELDVKQLQVAQIAHGLYLTGRTGAMQLAFTVRPDQFVDALRAKQVLNVDAGNQQRVIAAAETARHRLQDTRSQSQQVVQDAASLTKASAQRLAGLNALADRTSTQLTQAQDALQQALTARAEAARAAAARAARSRQVVAPVVSSGGASCSAQPIGDQANGNLEPGSLCPLWSAAGQRLRADAATAFNALSRYHAQTSGAPLCVTDSYRSYSEQVSVYHRKPGLAAVPGTSNHGWGLAVDLCGGVEEFGSSAYAWMTANAGRFGFRHPDWAQQGSSRPEAWHWEFQG